MKKWFLIVVLGVALAWGTQQYGIKVSTPSQTNEGPSDLTINVASKKGHHVCIDNVRGLWFITYGEDTVPALREAKRVCIDK